MALTTERWADIPGFDGRYQASTLGRIRSMFDRRVGAFVPCGPTWSGTVLSVGKNKAGVVHLRHPDGIPRTHQVAALVLETFVGPRPNGHHARHRGSDLDDSLRNIYWGTPTRKGCGPGRRKLTPASVRALRRLAEAGRTNKQIARVLRVSRSTVYDVRHGRTWTHVR